MVKNLPAGMGRDLGGGSGWGTHVNSWLIHGNVWQRLLQYCKVVSLKLKNKKNLPAKTHRRCRFDSWVGKIPWRRKWQSTPVVMPGKSHGQRSLAGYSLWGLKESDTTACMNEYTRHCLLQFSLTFPFQSGR